MTDLKKLAQELKTVTKRANTDLETVPYQTRASITSMVRDAQDQLVKLRADYAKVIRGNSLGLFLVGDDARQVEFAKHAATEAGAFVVEADALYQRLATRIEGSLSTSREFSVTQLQLLIGGLRDIERELDIVKMGQPVLRTERVIKDREDLVQYIRQVVQGFLGDDLTRLYVDKTINKLALDAEFQGSLLPVVVTKATADEVNSLTPLFTNASSVSVGTTEDGEVTQEFVLKQLSFVKKKLGKKQQ